MAEQRSMTNDMGILLVLFWLLLQSMLCGLRPSARSLTSVWFVGADATREQYTLANVESLAQLDNRAGLKQTREELRLLVGAQWEVGSHLAARVHVGMGVVRDRVTAWAQGEEINSLPIARPGGVELIWRW